MIKTNRLNQIPVETWNHLNINYASEEFALPSFGTKRLEDSPNLPSSVGTSFDEAVARGADTVNNYIVGSFENKGIVIERYNEGHVVHSLIDVAEGGSITLIRYLDNIRVDRFASLTQIKAGKDSEINFIEVNLCDDSSSVWSGVSVITEDNAKVNMTRIAFSGSTALYGVRADLRGEGSSFDIDTGYLVDKDRMLDINDVSNFYGRETRSFINNVGALMGSARKTLRDTVDFKTGSVHAVGHEKEDVVMFSDDVINLTTPLILCGEEWVEGQHAATTTRLDDRVLYYLESRGLSEPLAKRLVVCSKFAPVIDKIPDEEIKSAVYANLTRRLDENAGFDG